MNILEEKFKEVARSILPITVVIVVLSVFILDADWIDTALFFFCIALVIVGFTIFLAGVDVGIDPMGSAIGKEIPKRKSKLFMIAIIFTISFLVTVAEPDVTVFANQVHDLYSSISVNTLTYAIAIGVALFLIAAAMKIVYKLSLKMMMTISYSIVILIALYMAFSGNDSFLGIAFDSGGVTTGPVTVPVLLAIGIGICSIGKANKMDGFGMVGLASVGPIIALLIVGLFSGTDSSDQIVNGVTESASISFEKIGDEALNSLRCVLLALVPLTIFFIIFQKVFLRYSWSAVSNTVKGVAFAGIGVIIFLTGVYSGFMPTATALGQELIRQDINGFVIVGLGFLLGFLVAFAEPAVGILGGQVQNVSKGSMTKKSIIMLVSCGVALFVAIGMVRMMVDEIQLIYIVVPGYIITLILMWLTDDDLVGIAFDAGGVSTGPMSVAILSAMYVGMASVKYVASPTDAVVNGFGLIALIALAPCFFICLMNVYTKYKNKFIENRNAD